MSLLNAALQFLSYEDCPRSANPLVRTSDLKWSFQGIPTKTPKTVNLNLAPGESILAMSQLRAISYTTGTSFIITLNGTTAQIAASFGQRTGRSDGDATTQWVVSANGELATLTWSGTGTAPVFSGMVSGDGLTIGTPFSPLNQGDFLIVKVGSNFVQYVNPIAQGETQLSQVEIYSSGPVQKGDFLDITDPAFSFPNRGQFKITRITDSYVQFTNPLAVPETDTGVQPGGLNVYPDAFKWMLMACDQRLIVQLNGSTDLSEEVEPPSCGDLAHNPGLFFKRGKVFSVNVINPGQLPATGFIVLAP